jgi:hypothetical protein
LPVDEKRAVESTAKRAECGQRRGAPGWGGWVPRRGAAGGFAGVTGGGAASGGGAVTATTGFLQSVSQTS